MAQQWGDDPHERQGIERARREYREDPSNPRYGRGRHGERDAARFIVILILVSLFGGPILAWLIMNDVFSIL